MKPFVLLIAFLVSGPTAWAEMVRVEVGQAKAIAGRTADLVGQSNLICSGHAFSRILNQIENADEVYLDQIGTRVHLIRNDVFSRGKKREFADVQTDSTFTKILSLNYRQETLTTVYGGPINNPTAQVVWSAPSTTECLPPDAVAKRLLESAAFPSVEKP